MTIFVKIFNGMASFGFLVILTFNSKTDGRLYFYSELNSSVVSSHVIWVVS